jgi:hypothetical protein
MKYSTIRKRQGQRKRLAKTIKDMRSIKDKLGPETYNESLLSLKGIIGNYPKLKQRGARDETA